MAGPSAHAKEAAKKLAPRDALVRVGQVYLDVRNRRLYFLDAVARQLHREGIPFTPASLRRQDAYTASGQQILAADLPLMAAWRTGSPCGAQFLVPRTGSSWWQVAWKAAPYRNKHGKLLAILGAVWCAPPEPDWQRLAELAHDLRSPLAALQMLSPILKEMPEADENLQKVLHASQAAAERAAEIAHDLLEHCRGPAGNRARRKSTWFALEPFVTALASEQALAAKGKGLELRVDVSPVNDWEIYADRVALGRVLANLLSNAVRYTNCGQIVLRARWRLLADDQVLCLGVKDTGPGIADHEQEEIFEPFQRGRAGRESSHLGSGLGLYVVCRLAEELGMRVEVCSQFGKGSTFEVLVPTTLVRPRLAR
jgi:anti-sigma regulatory factor (Ser/Thr protein kinase)